eukprot:TRINITY_DN13754_c0_g1_i1.p1 TRINITY_DN13754_c0_g1~~TRINITY_DN13754_c0_g1_i1.p1  ORF type:complete len:304 (-),score=21.26 TRINITY_DN13754_c0_g1_i1:34-945(-)
MHPFYIGEAVFCLFCSSVCIVLFGLQIRAESHHKKLLGKIHRPYHRGGLVSSFALLAWSIDFQGALGIYDWQTNITVASCFSCCVYYIMMKGSLNMIKVVGRSGSQPGLFAWIEYHENGICVTTTVCAWIVAGFRNCAVILFNTSFYSGFFLLYLGLSFGACCILILATLWQYHIAQKGVSEPGSTFWSLACVKETQKMRYGIFGLLAISLAQLFSAFQYFAFPTNPSIPRDFSKAQFDYWSVLTFVGMGVVLHSSWLPIHCKAPKQEKELQTATTAASQDFQGKMSSPKMPKPTSARNVNEI